MKQAKEALVRVTRPTLNQPSRWLHWNGPSLIEDTTGEGEVYRVFNMSELSV